MEEILFNGIENIATAINLFAILILIVGTAKFIIQAVKMEIFRLRNLECVEHIQEIRVQLGSYILLALEFLIVSDILHSSISRTMDDLIILMLTVAVRIAISFFLGRELKEVKE